MKKLYMQLRIGEKIGFSFGVVGLLFVAVIWQYHGTLQRSLADYRELQAEFAARVGHALMIENRMLQARRAEKDFLLHRSEQYAAEVIEEVDGVLTEAGELSRASAAGAQSGQRIIGLVQSYRERFEALADAWRTRGLDHNSGLQGAFRDTVHRLEERAGNFNVGGLYLQLLQIRRGEKDLGLRGEVQYRDRVIGLLGAFEADVASSGLSPQLKQALSKETQAYRQAFLEYAQIVLARQDIQGGKGPFREIAHRIEDLLARHHVPGLGQDILQLRRREKDYLLRGDKQYVDMALKELSVIQQRLAGSATDAGNRQELQQLLDAYRRDFLALVEQDGKIARLDGEMRLAVTEVTRLVRDNVREAERAMAENSQRILASSTASARSMLWLAGLAALLGVVSALVITLSITRPLRRMAGLLDEVAYEQPIGRIAVVPGGRDEVNAMAQSVNTLAEHKSHFLDWWKASMRGSEAAERSALEGSGPALAEWAEARQARQALADELGGKVRDLLGRVVERARSLERTHPRGRQLQDMLEIEAAARSALAVLDVMGGSGSSVKG